ncbi:MAG: MFS transporter [Parasporobacterium sp.]|nr:MFS transporter [Parasporobacterium sp.]MBR3402604.1 MFS transporter [Parasporobacterium sp.]
MQKKSIGFGFRGWIVLIYQFLAFVMYVSLNNFGQNVMANVNANVRGWNATLVPTVYTIVCVVSVIIQFIFGKRIANSGKVKNLSMILLTISGVLTIATALNGSNEVLWLITWALATGIAIIAATFMVSTVVGQWFPRRKGTVMGLATLAFPVINGVGLTIFSNLLSNSRGNMIIAWLPWLILDFIAILLCGLFIKEYPEQCGAYPDNDKSMTPEVAKAMMEKQAEARKRSVWNLKNMARTVDFWLITIPQGILLIGAVGVMTQVMPIFMQFGYVAFTDHGISPTAVGAILLLVNAAIACAGSWILGIIDTKFGTKKAILISDIFMILSGIFCYIGNSTMNNVVFLIGFWFLQIFMGASSNFTVSSAAQYWKREDFPSAYSYINPLANLICAFGPIIVAGIGAAAGFTTVWIVIFGLGVLATILTLAFKPSRLMERDKLYRREAGLPEEGLSKTAEEMRLAK